MIDPARPRISTPANRAPCTGRTELGNCPRDRRPRPHGRRAEGHGVPITVVISLADGKRYAEHRHGWRHPRGCGAENMRESEITQLFTKVPIDWDAAAGARSARSHVAEHIFENGAG